MRVCSKNATLIFFVVSARMNTQQTIKRKEKYYFVQWEKKLIEKLLVCEWESANVCLNAAFLSLIWPNIFPIDRMKNLIVKWMHCSDGERWTKTRTVLSGPKITKHRTEMRLDSQCVCFFFFAFADVFFSDKLRTGSLCAIWKIQKNTRACSFFVAAVRYHIFKLGDRHRKKEAKQPMKIKINRKCATKWMVDEKWARAIKCNGIAYIWAIWINAFVM